MSDSPATRGPRASERFAARTAVQAYRQRAVEAGLTIPEASAADKLHYYELMQRAETDQRAVTDQQNAA